jgi:hypothetical protein
VSQLLAAFTAACNVKYSVSLILASGSFFVTVIVQSLFSTISHFSLSLFSASELNVHHSIITLSDNKLSTE